MKNNECLFCKKEATCFIAGIFGRETCQEFECALFVCKCPTCGAESDELWLPPSDIDRCPECGTYWCIHCGYLFKKYETRCPHEVICYQCSQENGYLKVEQIRMRICRQCEHYEHDTCEGLSKCLKVRQLLCPYSFVSPYRTNVWQCPKVQESLKRLEEDTAYRSRIRKMKAKLSFAILALETAEKHFGNQPFSQYSLFSAMLEDYGLIHPFLTHPFNFQPDYWAVNHISGYEFNRKRGCWYKRYRLFFKRDDDMLEIYNPSVHGKWTVVDDRCQRID